MKAFRSILFWMHLIAGLIIGLMALTGTTMALEKQIVT